jgi:hypothetical protein
MIFGRPWDAPICDDAVRYPEVPTYADCLRCTERFTDGDSGVIMPHVGPVDARHVIGVMGADRGGTGYVLVGEHRECHMSGVLGHIVGVCPCTGFDPDARATALEVQRRVDAGWPGGL